MSRLLSFAVWTWAVCMLSAIAGIAMPSQQARLSLALFAVAGALALLVAMALITDGLRQRQLRRRAVPQEAQAAPARPESVTATPSVGEHNAAGTPGPHSLVFSESGGPYPQAGDQSTASPASLVFAHGADDDLVSSTELIGSVVESQRVEPELVAAMDQRPTRAGKDSPGPAPQMLWPFASEQIEPDEVA